VNNKDVLPNFLVIGAQRCATSWMYFCLKEHPDIFLPFMKEIHFFDYNYEKGLEWYKRYFNTRSDQKVVGEISPSYLYIEKVPGYIYKHLRDVRLIICLRNPIDRAYSQYKKHLRAGAFSGSFEEAIEKDPQYIQRGFYFKQISRYLEFFPRDRILILIYEDIQKDSPAVLKNIFDFLEVDSDFIPSCIDKITPTEDLKNAYHYAHNISVFLRNNMNLGNIIDFIKGTYLQKVFDCILNSKLAYSMKFHVRADELKIDTIREETRNKLRSIFYYENSKVAELIGQDLSIWS
jgi:hypothetical protein